MFLCWVFPHQFCYPHQDPSLSFLGLEAKFAAGEQQVKTVGCIENADKAMSPKGENFPNHSCCRIWAVGIIPSDLQWQQYSKYHSVGGQN